MATGGGGDDGGPSVVVADVVVADADADDDADDAEVVLTNSIRPFSTMMLAAGGRMALAAFLAPPIFKGIDDLSVDGELGADNDPIGPVSPVSPVSGCWC